MASMDDLIATLGGVQAGQHGNDLRDLHAKLQQTIPTQPYYRPIPPSSSSSIPPSHSTGPLPPPAPASSWNTPTVLNGRDQSGLNGFGFGSAFGGGSNGGGAMGGGNGSPRQPGGFGAGVGTSPLRQPAWGAGSNANQYPSGGQGMNGGGGVPGPKAVPADGGRRLRSQGPVEEEADRPYHASVLPVKASPKDTGGFEQDAFRPLWAGRGQGGTQGRDRDEGMQVNGGGDWGGFTGEKL